MPGSPRCWRYGKGQSSLAGSRSAVRDVGTAPAAADVEKAESDYASLGIENSRLPATLSLLGSYGYSKPPEGQGDPLETWRGEAGLSRAMQPWLTGHIGYSYLWQREIGGADFHRSRAEVGLTASLQ